MQWVDQVEATRKGIKVPRDPAEQLIWLAQEVQSVTLMNILYNLMDKLEHMPIHLDQHQGTAIRSQVDDTPRITEPMKGMPRCYHSRSPMWS